MARRKRAPVTDGQRLARAERERERARVQSEAWMQDLEFMASTGETTDGAAERWGISRDGAWKRADKAGRLDLWERLQHNEVVRFGATLGEIRRLERANREKGTLRGPRRVA